MLAAFSFFLNSSFFALEGVLIKFKFIAVTGRDKSDKYLKANKDIKYKSKFNRKEGSAVEMDNSV